MSWFAPCLSITAVCGANRAALPSLLDNEHIRRTLPDDDLRPLLLTSGQDDASRVIMLPFAAQQGQTPAAVIKIATDPRFNAETEHEQTVLHKVRSRLQPAMHQGIPLPLVCFHFQHSAVSVESRAPGKSLWLTSGGWGVSPRTKIADVEVSTRWLIQFHRQTEVERRTWDSCAITRWVEEPLDAYLQWRGESEAEARLFAAMRQHAHDLLGAELPLVWQHHDFAPWNLFRAGDQLTVIDWEFNRSWEETHAGPALCDLLYFLTYWNNLVHRHYDDSAEFEGMRRLYVNKGDGSRYVRGAHQAIAKYMAALNMDWRFLPLLLAYTWIERVVYSHTRMQKLNGPSAHSRAADKFAGYVALLASHTDQLFGAGKRGLWQDQVQQTQPTGDASDAGRPV
jgi:hypothetical protein